MRQLPLGNDIFSQPGWPAFGRFLFRSSAVRLCFVLALVLSLAATASAQSSSALPAALEQPAEVRPETRAELRRELDRHVEVLEAQSAVLKIVAKLVGPSVVHIEADMPVADADSQYPHGKRLEESGSGVIIEWKDKYYVLTNRHVVRNAAPAAVRIRLADGRLLHPTKILADYDTDVGVLAISAPDLVAAPVGDSDRHGNRRFRARRGKSLRADQFGHVRNHQRQGPPRSSFERRHRQVPRLFADRRRDQSRQ